MWLQKTKTWLCLPMMFVLIDASYGVKSISAELGQNVSLPCKVLSGNNNITAIKWIRPDLGKQYVLFCRDGQLDPDNQLLSYENRVDLQDKEMKDGDAALLLMNVTMEDRGTYKCLVFQRKTNRRKRSIAKSETISIINLDVHPSNETLVPPSAGDQDGIIGGSVGAVLCLFAVMASVGVVIYRRHRKKPDLPPRSPLPDEEAGDIQLNLLNRG